MLYFTCNHSLTHCTKNVVLFVYITSRQFFCTSGYAGSPISELLPKKWTSGNCQCWIFTARMLLLLAKSTEEYTVDNWQPGIGIREKLATRVVRSKSRCCCSAALLFRCWVASTSSFSIACFMLSTCLLSIAFCSSYSVFCRRSCRNSASRTEHIQQVMYTIVNIIYYLFIKILRKSGIFKA